jgi:hypothetical protein
MIRKFVSAAIVTLMALYGFSFASADTVTHVALPGDVPDEQEPRGNLGDAPSGFGTSSWQGPETGKSNYHVRYDADGDILSTIFPDDAASLTLSDISSISYFTKRPDGTPVGQDWWIQIYTRPTGSGDDAGWYKSRFINDYTSHTDTGDWTLYSTDTGMQFRKPSGTQTALMSFDALKSGYGAQLIEMISVQTDSGWNGFDGYIDGLTITLTNGNVGVINFEAVPEPAGIALASMALVGAAGYAFRRRRQTRGNVA